MSTDRQYVVARKIKEIAGQSFPYPSGMWNDAQSAIVGYAVELATLVLEDESDGLEAELGRSYTDDY